MNTSTMAQVPQQLQAPLPALAAVNFPAGMPGFREARTFTLSPWGDGPSPFVVLECIEVTGLRFVAVEPGVFFPWYKPRLGPDILEAVEAGAPEDVDVLAILTLRSRPEETTANLLGPVVVNPQTGKAVQAVLSGSGFDAATPVVQQRR